MEFKRKWVAGSQFHKKVNYGGPFDTNVNRVSVDTHRTCVWRDSNTTCIQLQQKVHNILTAEGRDWSVDFRFNFFLFLLQVVFHLHPVVFARISNDCSGVYL
jgi:hypothetical protein